MTNIIIELQKNTIDSNYPISDLLRKAKLVSVKLNLTEFTEWVELELSGYENSPVDLPKYRIVRGTPKALNPYHGWQPIIFNSNEIAENMSKHGISQPLIELETLLESDSTADFSISYSNHIKRNLIKATGFETDYSIFIGRNTIKAILDGVRNTLLDWVLKLEKAGVKGEDMMFSKKEKEEVINSNVNYNIAKVENFNGVMGNITNSSDININQEVKVFREALEYVKKKIENSDLPEESLNEINSYTKKIDDELLTSKPNETKLKGLFKSVKSIFEGTAGNIIAQEVLNYLSKINL